jgi:uncharacterized delta-60 repeat protein
MALPSSGSISASQINVELTRSSTSQFIINGSSERNLAGKTSGQISFSDFWGKSAAPQPGDIDSTFNVKANSTLWRLIVLPDDKIVIGGFFTAVNGVVATRIARINSNGTVDTSFVGSIGTQLNDLALQSDGKILVATNGGLIRLNSNGTVDSSFNSSLVFNSILISGSIIYGTQGAPKGICALNLSNGSEVSSFNVGTGSGSLETSAVQSTGRVVLGGGATTFNGTSVPRLFRLFSNGSVDTSFNSGGSGPNSTVFTTLRLPDDKIVIGGSFTSYNGVEARYLARINSNGTLDTTFTSSLPSDRIDATIVRQSDGKLLVGGRAFTYNDVSGPPYRITANGQLDLACKPEPEGYWFVRDLGIQSTGRIINASGSTRLVRYIV